jgi:hypothetical protein
MHGGMEGWICTCMVCLYDVRRTASVPNMEDAGTLHHVCMHLWKLNVCSCMDGCGPQRG